MTVTSAMPHAVERGEQRTQRSSGVKTEDPGRPGGPGDGLAPPAGAPKEVAFAAADLGAVRRVVARWADDHALGAESVEELVLAVNELSTNSIRYGGGRGVLLLWRERDVLMCEVRDNGHIEDPLAGQRRPSADAHSGRGLWLVHQLCDLVQIDSSPRGTAVRVHKQMPSQ